MAIQQGSAIFRFDAIEHRYLDPATSKEFPHITGMLQRTGWIDDTWYTEESSARGTAIHRLTADYDLGSIDVASCVSKYRPQLLGHAKLMSMLQPTWFAIEEPLVHPLHRFGGRPDRIGLIQNLTAVNEIKSGGKEKSHQIQTALQAILAELVTRVPPTAIARWAEYITPKGRAKMEPHEDLRDFDEAYRIIRVCTQ